MGELRKGKGDGRCEHKQLATIGKVMVLLGRKKKKYEKV